MCFVCFMSRPLYINIYHIKLYKYRHFSGPQTVSHPMLICYLRYVVLEHSSFLSSNIVK